MAAAIKNVTVIGGGLMGSGIAQVKQSKKYFLRFGSGHFCGYIQHYIY
jgi:hypothetical protein